MNSIKNQFLPLVFFIVLLTGCTSQFDKAQREKQENITLSVSQRVSSELSSLMNILIDTLQEPADINSQNFLFLTQQFPEISALFLYDDELNLQGKYPVTIDTKDILKNCLTNQKRKNIASIREPIIGHALHINTHAFLCIVIPLFGSSQANPDLALALINTEIFFSHIEEEDISPYPYSLIIINGEQEVVYDSDPIRIGKNFLSKADSEDYDLALTSLYNMMTENKTDYFITNIKEQSQMIKKIYTWHTINPYDETFYVTLIRNISKNNTKQSKGVYLLSSLRSYAIQDTLIDPIVDNQPDDAQQILKLIYDNNPGIYSIQLADTTGTILVGWPSCNSITGYCISQKRNKSFDNALQEVIEKKVEHNIQSELLEGGNGKIIFIPVLVHEDIYGVLIAIEPEGN